MRKIIIAPGAFKHSLGVVEVTEQITLGLAAAGLNYEFVQIPIADGGNGTLDAFLLQGGERVTVPVLDPLGRKIESEIGLIDDGKTAVIEMALASGVELLDDDELNPFEASTIGTGQLLNAALAQNVGRVIIGMGGSATVDGGIGALGALGVKFFAADGTRLQAHPTALGDVVTVDGSDVTKRWRDVEVIIASDVDNPTLGSQGAAAVFGPQKGAKPTDIPLLEAHLDQFFTAIAEARGVNVKELAGGGAAGALSAGLSALLGGTIRSGIDLILEAAHFNYHLEDASLVITGEGRIDAQTLHGKGPLGIVRHARNLSVPAVAFVGSLDYDEVALQQAGFAAVLSVVDKPMSLNEALSDASDLLFRAARRLGYCLQLGMDLA